MSYRSNWAIRSIGLAALCEAACSYEPDAQNDPRELQCQPRALVLNAAEMGEQAVCRETQCSTEPDGSAIMSYCIDPSSWATCSVATGKNLDWFDADHDGQGVLEVTFCTDQQINGAVDLWYGEFPNRKFLTLLAVGETMDISCRTVYFTPGMACYPAFDLASMTDDVRGKSLPPSCGNECGKTPSQCRKPDFEQTRLTLAAEYAQVSSQASLRLLSIRYFPPACQCVDDLDCAGGERSICRSGVCVVGGTADCGDMVGRYADGWHSGASDAIAAAYLRHYPRLGCPFANEKGPPYVHDVYGLDLQDYFQSSPADQMASDGQTGLIYNPGVGQAFLLFGEFWGAFKCLRDGGHAVGGSTLLGAPTDEQHLVDGSVRQNFEAGWLTRDVSASGVALTVHLATQHTRDADVSSHCDELPPIGF